MKLKCLAHSSGDFCGSPTNCNHMFMKNETKNEKIKNTVNHAIELSWNIFDRTHTPKSIVCTDTDGALVQCPRKGLG